jgi:hypothetical protein
MKINYSLGKAGIATVLLAALTGCTTYVVQRPEPQPAYVPAPPPEPQPVYVQQPAPPPAVVVIQREEDFYQPLTPYGEWVVVGDYGRCWRPARVEAGWRPYSNGHWELTDDGWYWASDEPWAWATYHYGRWEQAASYGWIWVPQTQWAPAWVSWREGGGYVGWAPMPPERRGGVSVNVTIAPAAFCFVPEGRMHDPVRPTTVIVNNTTIINKTVNITRTKVVNKVVINDGPRSADVERVSGRKIQKVSVGDLRHQEEEPVAEKHSNLRAPAGDRGPEQKQPAPRLETRPQDSRNQDNRPAPVVQPPVRTEPAPTRPQRNMEPQPAPATPTREARPVREQKSQPTPAPREVRPVQKPAEQAPTDTNNRNRQPARPQQPEAQPAPKAEPNRTANPPKQQNQPAPRNNRNAGNARNNRDTGATNAVDNPGQNGRRQ